MSGVDHKRRSEHLLGRLTAWAAQAHWEREHGISLVNWEAAFLRLIAEPDGKEPIDEIAVQTRLARDSIELLLRARTVLRTGSLGARRRAAQAIEEHLSHLLPEADPLPLPAIDQRFEQETQENTRTASPVDLIER